MNIQIRKPRRKDLKYIAQIYLEEFSKPPYNEKWDIKTASDKIGYFLKIYDIFVALDDSKVLGFIVCNFNFWNAKTNLFIEELAIEGKSQSKGIGKKLVKYVENYYEERGAKNIVLISNKKSKAYNFYRKLDYKFERDNVLLSKKIGDSKWKQEKLS